MFIIQDGKILMGKRKGAHGVGMWCPPGGHLEFGESWEECCRRETMEEAGIEISDIRFVTAVNDVSEEWGTHYVTLLFVANYRSGEVQNCEPDKCDGWEWFAWEEFPEPLFLPIKSVRKTSFHPLAK